VNAARIRGTNLVRYANSSSGFVMTLCHVTLSSKWPWGN